jgi:hypothetical protein
VRALGVEGFGCRQFWSLLGLARLGWERAGILLSVGRICSDTCGSLCSVHLDSCSHNSLPLVSPMLMYHALLRTMDCLYCARKWIFVCCYSKSFVVASNGMVGHQCYILFPVSENELNCDSCSSWF